MDCLAEPLPSTVPTRMVAKRFDLLCATLVKVSPSFMSTAEINLQDKLLEEVLNCLDHSVAQV